MELTLWLADISYWYQSHKHDQGDALRSVLFSAPPAVFGPHLSDEQSKAIACWLDGCLRLFQHYRYNNPSRAFEYLMYTASKLEQVGCNSSTDIEIRDWCLKRLQHITVLSLEFCAEQSDQTAWLAKANRVIEGHVKLMEALAWNESRKHDQVIWH
ncbi:transcriptional regulator [Vibrio navarrensis]|uniref:transcriptional regulator n=1 Tax=Vibrio navarrensis TaxID=29495 RepID=UPI001866516F|nr:transcriptional regulator [Vibrio navarrensis]MBE3665730.1 transcriptional regulator [Vibrio navarrensis]MBE4572386.1 transcriptional regulator [Vibrio navarrensis]MBE4608363.1 transcriptional regulator [Vibrio navarrensis]MBE4611477.1 transcriptional regulator [Vibrio navarrensis]